MPKEKWSGREHFEPRQNTAILAHHLGSRENDE